MSRYTAVMIGGGPAGHTCAVRIAQLGGKVAIVERDYVGGICTNWGCTPSKAMIESAKIARTVRESSQYGVHTSEVRVDFGEVAARRDRIIRESREVVADLLRHHNVDIYQGEAEIVAPDRVKFRMGKLDRDGRVMHYTGEEGELEADHIVLATGSYPLIPDFVERDDPLVVSSNRLITIGSLPETLTIVGGGVIGLEFATIFSNLGSQVTVIEYLDRVLATLDPEISEEIKRLLEASGVTILTSHQVVGTHDGRVRAINRQTDEVVEIASEAVLIAIGRTPVINQEMFDRMGIEYTQKGISVDEFLRTNVSGIWAIGDATGKSILAHVGMQQG
ncbi:MAG: dihydrolipoyl dehydrogenase family protein, partial [Ardenticatenaceae bacterium]